MEDMRRKRLCLWFCLLICTSRAATIVSEVQSVAVLNGVPQTVTELTVNFGPADEGVPFNLDIANSQSGTTDSLTFTHQPPQYIYTHQLFGWIPRAIYAFNNMVCIYDTQPVNSSLQNQPSVEQYSVSSGDPFVGTQAFVQRSASSFSPSAVSKVRDRSHRVLPPHFLPKAPKPKANEASSKTTNRTAAGATNLPANALDRIPVYRSNILKREAVVFPNVQRPDISIAPQPILDLPELGAGDASILASDASVQITATSVDAMAAKQTTTIAQKAKALLKSGASGVFMAIGSVVWVTAITMGINALCEHVKIPLIGNVLCGSGGNAQLQKILNTMVTAINQTQQEINNISNVLQIQQAWDVTTQTSIDLLQSNQQVQGQEIQLALNDITLEQENINTVSQVLFSYINQTQAAFEAANVDISGLAGTEAQLYNFTNQVYQSTQSQITSILSQINTLDLSVMQMTMQVFANAYNIDVRRALVAQLWMSIVNAETNLPSCIFTQCIGYPPLTANGPPLVYNNSAQCPASYSSCSYILNQVPTTNILSTTQSTSPPESLAAIKNLYSAGMMSMVRLQYTDTASNQAIERQISYNCDKQFLLNNYLPGINFLYLFRFIGPPYNGTSYCYNQDNPGVDTWTCNCVVVETFDYCTMITGAPIFPFGWQQTTSLASSSQISQYCNSDGLVHSALVSESEGTNYAIETAGMIFSSTTTWTSFLTALCESSSGWAVSSAGTRVRVASDTTEGFVDMTLDPSIPNVCASDIATLTTVTANNTELLAYNIYDYWANGYQVITLSLIGYWDQQVYGTMMTDVEYDYQEFNKRPDIQQTGACTSQTILKYAGTGIQLNEPYSDTLGSDPADLNPSEVTNGDTYPPFPSFSIESTAIGNTDKLPLYSIAPVAQAYNPTLSINNGECIVVNGTCTTPMNGLNFSTSLSVSLTTEWQNLLPGETVWVGDFNQLYSLAGEPQVVYDIPANLLPQSTTRASVCNSLLYLVQPRTSSYASDPLFNIPDTDFGTDINAIDWVTFYSTFFDPTCATESASTYARSVDSSGVCQQNVFDNGTVSNITNGNYDVCTLMNAFWVVVPNYVSAFMYFQPRQYTVQATFLVPQGELIQNISTACPTGYNVTTSNETNGATYITFFTSATTTQQATFTVTGYGACSSTQTYQFSFSASTPFTTPPLAACGTQYGQVYPYLSNQPCYDSPGIEMYRAYNSNDGPITPSTTVTYVDDITNSLTAGLVNVLMGLLNAQMDIMTIPYMANSTDDVINQYGSKLQAQISALQNPNLTTISPSMQTLITNAQASLQNNSATIQANLLVQYQLASLSSNLSAALNVSVAAGNVALQKVNQAVASESAFVKTTNAAVETELAQARQEIADLNSNNPSSCIFSIIPIFGSDLCELLNGLESGIGAIFGSLFSIIIILGICICSCCICIEVGPMLCKRFSKWREEHEEEQEKEKEKEEEKAERKKEKEERKKEEKEDEEERRRRKPQNALGTSGAARYYTRVLDDTESFDTLRQSVSELEQGVIPEVE